MIIVEQQHEVELGYIFKFHPNLIYYNFTLSLFSLTKVSSFFTSPDK